jgi:3-hydroxyisobutyrate dehydrogenase
MALNVHKALDASADKLIVYDAFPAAVDAFTARCPSAVAASSASEVVQSSETIITSLPNTSHVQSVFDPFLKGTSDASALKGKLFIDTSTIAPAATKQISDALAPHGATLVDAPVSGGVVGAQAGTLTFMVSQPSSVPWERIGALLTSMGKRIVICGDYPGAGLAAKLANNYALALTNLATCDAMLLGQKLGLDPKVLAEVLNTSTGKSWPSESNNPVPGVLEKAPASRDYEGGFGISLMRKDLDLALEAERKAGEVAGSGGVSGSLSSLSKEALHIYKTVEAIEEHSKKDFSVVYKWLRDGR